MQCSSLRSLWISVAVKGYWLLSIILLMQPATFSLSNSLAIRKSFQPFNSAIDNCLFETILLTVASLMLSKCAIYFFGIRCWSLKFSTSFIRSSSILGLTCFEILFFLCAMIWSLIYFFRNWASFSFTMEFMG